MSFKHKHFEYNPNMDFRSYAEERISFNIKRYRAESLMLQEYLFAYKFDWNTIKCHSSSFNQFRDRQALANYHEFLSCYYSNY